MSKRPKIPKEIEDELLVNCVHTCTICRRAKGTVHHIDENPSNNEKDNLTVLCPNCQSDVHSNPKLIKRITQSQVKIYRDEWIKICSKRHEVLPSWIKITNGERNDE